MNKRKKITVVILLYDKMIVSTKQIRNNSKRFLLKSDHRLINASSMNNAKQILKCDINFKKIPLRFYEQQAEPIDKKIFYNANLIKLMTSINSKLRSRILKDLKVNRFFARWEVLFHFALLNRNFFTNQLAQVQPIESK